MLHNPFLFTERDYPSFGNPVYILRQEQEPPAIPGYKWFFYDVSCYSWNRYIGSDSAWALHRMYNAPKKDNFDFEGRLL